MTVSTAIPAVSLECVSDQSTAARQAAAQAVDQAFRTHGFLIAENHGVPESIITNAWDAAHQFFDLPIAARLESRPDEPGCPRGYLPMEAEALARSQGKASAPDPKECFSSGQPRGAPSHLRLAATDADFFFGENIWPAALPEFRGAWLDYYAAMEQLAARLLSLCASALDLPGDYFAPYFDHHASALRALNYPASEPATEPPAIRAGAHTDYGTLTILKPDAAAGGLEIRLTSGEWTPAPAIADAFIVNVGDLLSRWSNDRWTSTMHRVTGSDEQSRRQSIAFFQNPNFDALIECLPGCATTERPVRYTPVMAGDYLRERFTSTL